MNIRKRGCLIGVTFFLFFSCNRVHYKKIDEIIFGPGQRITVAECLDLDQNGSVEIIMAVTDGRKLEPDETGYSSREIVSSSIYIFEEKGDVFRYIWKSSPLMRYEDGRVFPEKIETAFFQTIEGEDILHLQGDRSTYQLGFSGERYHLGKLSDRLLAPMINRDIKNHFDFYIDNYYTYVRGANDFLFLETENGGQPILKVYKIRYRRKKLFKRIGEYKLKKSIMTCVVRDHTKNRDLLLVGTSDGVLEIYTVSGLR